MNKIVIHKVLINKKGQRAFFTITLPHDNAIIHAAKVSARLITNPEEISFGKSRKGSIILRNTILADVRLSVHHKEGLFFSEQITPQDNNVGFADFSSKMWLPKYWTHSMYVSEPHKLEVESPASKVYGMVKDLNDLLIYEERIYEVIIYLWTKPKNCES